MTVAVQTAAASASFNLLSVLLSIVATVALIRWALRPRPCRACGGTGAVPGLMGWRPCPRCNRPY